MRHYEIILMVHPDFSDRVLTMVQQYRTLIETDAGKVHRLEDWGRKSLAYPIKRLSKAHYVLMNIECTDKALAELKHDFRYNEAVVRNLVLRKEEAIKEPSPMFKPVVTETEETVEG